MIGGGEGGGGGVHPFTIIGGDEGWGWGRREATAVEFGL